MNTSGEEPGEEQRRLRTEWIAAVEAHLRRGDPTSGPSPAVRAAVLEDAERLGGGERMPLPGHLPSEHIDLLVPPAEDTLESARVRRDLPPLEAAVGLWRRLLAVTPSRHDEYGIMLSDLAGGLRTLFSRTGRARYLEEAAELGLDAVRATPVGHVDRALLLSDLAVTLVARFEYAGDSGDLDTAVDAGREAVATLASDDPDRAWHLATLADARLARFRETGLADDIDEAIRLQREALALQPENHPDRGRSLSLLGTMLRIRFEHAGELADLEDALEAARRAVTVTPEGHPGRPWHLSQLTATLVTRFEHGGPEADLDEAVRFGLVSVAALRHATASYRAMCLSNLGTALHHRHLRDGPHQDLDDAVECAREALDLTPEGHSLRAVRLSNLGVFMQLRYRGTGALEDLDRAVTYGRAAVAATGEGHARRAAMLHNLGTTLQFRFDRTGSLDNLRQAVEAGRDALAATPTGHPERTGMLSGLAGALQAWFLRTGAPDDLEEAVDLARQAVAAHHTRRVGALTVLSAVLQTRFRRTGAQEDLDQAIAAVRDAVSATPPEHPDHAARLWNLAGALQARYQRTSDQGDLDEALDHGRKAVEGAPRGPYRSLYLSGLGAFLRLSFERTGAPDHLREAIDTARRAVAEADHDDQDRAAYLSNLGLALQSEFERTGRPEHLAAAITVGQEAVDAAAEGHPDQAMYLCNLGIALRLEFERSGNSQHQDAAVSAYLRATRSDTAPPSRRVWAARAAAELLVEEDPAQASDLLENAVLTLPEVAPRQLRRGDMQYALGRWAFGLAGEAAALALTDPRRDEAQRATRALRLLEAGRAVMFSQVLDTRDDLTDLRAEHPALAERFTALRDLLDQPDAAPGTAGAVDRSSVARDLAALLDRIRALDGFVAFASPPATEELLAQAGPGPVVTLNVTAHRSDALLLTERGITVLPLPALTPSSVARQVDAFHGALGTPSPSPEEAVAAERTITSVLEWLWDHVAGPVLDALDGAPSHVWWAPGGLLGLLPLHAAGYHHDPVRRRTVLDRVVSSYTPTIRALRHARRRSDETVRDERGLIVAAAESTDENGLLHVAEEVAAVRGHLPDAVLLDEELPGEDASTLANVLAQLRRCALAHFACHGAIDPADPSRSSLALRGTERLTVADLASVPPAGARLAFLSACETALHWNFELIDEAIHLTSAFQLAGFSRVIGTLWEVDDALSVDVADAFYGHLRTPEGGHLDAERAAVALHRTVLALRQDFLGTPSLWAAYLHTGA